MERTKEFRHIGKATPRKEGRQIVTGAVKYIDDLTLPGMLYGKVLRSPHAHALINKIDTTKAERAAGVKAVLTHENAPDWKFGIPRVVALLDKKVRYAGDAVAIVAAESEELALAALELIEVEYEPLKAVYDIDEATAEGAPDLYEEFPGNLLPTQSIAFGPNTLKEVVLGDVERGFAEADLIYEANTSYDNIPNPLPIEPPGVIARWDSPNELTVWSASQSVSWHRFMMMGKMGFPEIRSIGTQCGGSFGSKNHSPQPFFYAAALAKATGAPVKMLYSKEEHFGAFVLRLGSRFTGKIGLKRDGTVTAIEGEWLVDTGAFSDQAQTQIAVGLGELQLVIRCQNWRVIPKVICTNRAPSGIVRGFGGQELESSILPVFMEAISKEGLDPVDFLKNNFVKPGEGYLWREGNWWVCRGQDYAKAVEEGAKAFGWDEKWKGWLTPSSTDGHKRRGIGVGVHGNADVGEDESEAYVRLTPDGGAVIHANVAESGMGQRSSLIKMVAETLNLPLEKVTMTEPDTMVAPFEFGLTGSRGTWAVGTAVITAAEDALKKLHELAAPRLGVKAEELESENGIIRAKGSDAAQISWRKVIGVFHTVTGHGFFEPDFSMPNFMMLFVEVEVDTGTGQVTLERVVAATDAGRIIDPPSLDGQIYGALGAAGLDTAIFEETVIDKRTGRNLNMNMIDYKWRTFEELPVFDNVILENPLPSHRFGAIGIGEISTSPGPAAVLMAVSNAIGTRLSSYPLAPEKILAAVKSAGEVK